MPELAARTGQVLFRIRSFSPLPVLAVMVWLLWRGRASGDLRTWVALDALGLLVALAGQALRFYTLGQVQDGTSGQGAVLEARALNTRGPYAHVRNPLYLGNLGLCIGLMMLAHDGWVLALGLAFFFGEYHFIIRAEEAFLREQFGERFTAYCGVVRRWVPRLSPASTGALRAGFDWRRALKKEHNPFAAWASGALALLAWQAWQAGALSGSLAVGLGAAEVAVLATFVGIKGYKHGWLRARPSAVG
jgi:protein-S-isoprenylcysteine O-methyltransferase Ste14